MVIVAVRNFAQVPNSEKSPVYVCMYAQCNCPGMMAFLFRKLHILDKKSIEYKMYAGFWAENVTAEPF